MTQQPDQSSDERWRQRDERSRLFLEEIDQLDDAITATADKKLRGKLQRQREKVGQKFAEHLDDGDGLGYVGSHARSVMPVWRVTKVPSKKHRAEAQAWMAQRGVGWDGSAPPLRHEVRKALEQGEPIPEGKFGLHVERTVAIKSPQAYTMNILGEAVHIVPDQKRDIGVTVKVAPEDFVSGEN